MFTGFELLRITCTPPFPLWAWCACERCVTGRRSEDHREPKTQDSSCTLIALPGGMFFFLLITYCYCGPAAGRASFERLPVLGYYGLSGSLTSRGRWAAVCRLPAHPNKWSAQKPSDLLKRLHERKKPKKERGRDRRARLGAEHESNQHAAAPGQRWAVGGASAGDGRAQRAKRDAGAHGAQHQGGGEETKAVEGKQAKGSAGGGAAPARPPER